MSNHRAEANDRRLHTGVRRLALPAAALLLAACSRQAGSSPVPENSAGSKSPLDGIPSGTIGYDVSVTQGDGPLPGSADFAVVGVNATNARGLNPHFASEMRWASRLTYPPAVYVLTGNPGAVVDDQKVADWPGGGKNGYGTCDGSNSAACSYEYGRQRAAADLEYTADFEYGTVALNVEAGNFSWLNPPANRAALEGFTETFQAAGKAVMVYSDKAMWSELVGGTPPASSPLHGLPVWMLGASSLREARTNCQEAGFTGGPVVMAQMAGNSYPIDQDLVC